MRNTLPDKRDGTSPIERFSRTEVRSNLKWHHTFGCPVYALDNRLRQGKRMPRWDPRARLGIYLGESPRHARSVSLVLSTTTGLVFPQFHVKHDDFFETISPRKLNVDANWQTVAGFTDSDSNVPQSNPSPAQLSIRPIVSTQRREVQSTMPPPTEVVNQNGSAQDPNNPTEDVLPNLTLQPTEEEINYSRAPSTNPIP